MPPTYVFGDDARLLAPIPAAVATASGTIAANSLLPCNTTSAAQTQTLPAAPADRTVAAVLIVAGTHTVTVATAGTDVFLVAAGATSAVLSGAGSGAWWMYNAAAKIWYEIGSVGSSGGSGVSSFNTRTGAVVPASGDYSFSLVSGTATIGQGGTGQTTQQAALDALAGATTSGQYLRGNGTHVALAAIQAADVPTLNQNTTGSAASFTGSLAGDVTGTQASTTVGKIQGVAVTATEATLVSDLNNAATRSASATLLPGEETVFTGSTASQTLTLPSSTTAVSSSINSVTNAASVSVTVAAGTGTTVNNFGTTGSIVVPAGYAFSFVYVGTTWYVTAAGPSDFAKSNLLAIGNGGTGQSTAAAAIAALAASGLTWPAYEAPKVVTLTDAATVAINAANGNDFRLTMTSGVGATRALGAPSNPVDGQRIDIMVTQDATGSRLLTYNAAFEFSTSLPSPTLSTGASVTDILGFIYNAAKSKWLFVAFLSGFA